MEKKENNKDILEYQLKDFKDLKKDLRWGVLKTLKLKPETKKYRMEVLKIATAGSVDDGKSTLIGRLLWYAIVDNR
jgi:GTPase